MPQRLTLNHDRESMAGNFHGVSIMAGNLGIPGHGCPGFYTKTGSDGIAGLCVAFTALMCEGCGRECQTRDEILVSLKLHRLKNTFTLVF